MEVLNSRQNPYTESLFCGWGYYEWLDQALKSYLSCPGQDSESEHTLEESYQLSMAWECRGGGPSPPNPHLIYLLELLQRPDGLWKMAMNTVNLTK